MQTDVLIIGGGLSGLSLALALEQQGCDYQLIEARTRFGGRIYSPVVNHKDQSACFDAGPSWFWPGQPRMLRLLDQLGIPIFEQYSQGDVLYEDEQGTVHHGVGHASMQGSYRVEGGMARIIDSIVTRLPTSRLQLTTKAQVIARHNQLMEVHVIKEGGVKQVLSSRAVVLALPPRVAVNAIDFQPALSQESIAAMESIPTWMAAHAKVIAVYRSPFWREAGLSGDAMSRCGPITEIHDASPGSGGPYALFGFIGVPAASREGQRQALLDSALQQLTRLFGSLAASPITLILQDWSFEPETATPLDFRPLYGHPEYGLPGSLTHLCDGRLLLGSTETAPQFGGYLEGALEASEITLQKLMP